MQMFLITSDGPINNLLILLYSGQAVYMDFVLTCFCSRELDFEKASLKNELMATQILRSFKVFSPFITNNE